MGGEYGWKERKKERGKLNERRRKKEEEEEEKFIIEPTTATNALRRVRPHHDFAL